MLAKILAMEDSVLSDRLQVVEHQANQLRAGFEVLFPGAMNIQDPLVTEQLNFTLLIGEIGSESQLKSSDFDFSSFVEVGVDSAIVDANEIETMAQIQAQGLVEYWPGRNRMSGSAANRCLNVLYALEDELIVLISENETRKIKRDKAAAHKAVLDARTENVRRRSIERRAASATRRTNQQGADAAVKGKGKGKGKSKVKKGGAEKSKRKSKKSKKPKT
jgi:hypothetical protein